MLIIVVLVFLLCQLPQAMQNIYLIYHVVVGVERTAYQKQVAARSTTYALLGFLVVSIDSHDISNHSHHHHAYHHRYFNKYRQNIH